MIRATLGALAACTLLLGPACGKKGPPLAPIIRIPAAVDQIAARRVGDDLYVSLTVPARNVDATTPADVEQVVIYAFTGRTAPPRPRWAEVGTLIATIPVRPPATGDAAPADESPAAGAAQGASVTVKDVLSPDELAAPAADASTLAGPGAPAGGVVRRFVTAFALGPRGRPSPPGATADIQLGDLPAPPLAVRVSYTDRGTTVTWELPPPPPGPAEAPVIAAPPAAPEPPPLAAPPAVPEPPPPPAAPRYNIYRELQARPDTVGVPAAPWSSPIPTPVNTDAIDGSTFEDDVEFDRERCYTVRTVRGTGAGAVESVPSRRVCVVPSDTFPPQPPSSPATVAADGVITLVWEPNTEPDLGGYLVLRGDAGDDTLRPLTPAPIAEARYRDADVIPGRRYVYVVIAVDTRTPFANASAASARVEETAR